MTNAAESTAPPVGPAIDHEALLVALVLAPATYSRNRFFELYRDPAVRNVRRRASIIRAIVRHVTRLDPKAGEIVRVVPCAEGVELTYVLPSLGLRRTTILEPLELALIRFAMGRSATAGAPLGKLPHEGDDRMRIESVLARLAP